jgi:hypothetical protein
MDHRRLWIERWVLEDSWPIFHKLDPLVEGSAGNQVESDVGVAVVDAL